MQVTDRISVTEARASRLNLSLWRVCKMAGVDFSNISRWRTGQVSPTIARFEDVMGKLEAKLGDLEKAMVAGLRTHAQPDGAPLQAAE
jgi:hypothetical protein